MFSQVKNVAIFLLLFHFSMSLAFQEFKSEMESMSMQISTKMGQYYTNWCKEGSTTCESLSYNGCKGVRKKVCDLSYNKPSFCFSEGAYISTASNVHFPPYMDYQNLSPEDIKFVCSSAKLEKTFKHFSSKRDKKFQGMFFGSVSGIFRVSPGTLDTKLGKCDDYDPRMRPWYTIAVSGSKNVVILVDRSIIEDKNGDNIKIAVNSLIDTLSLSDNIGVIAFFDEAKMLGGFNILVSASSENKNKLKQEVNKLTFYSSNETQLDLGFCKGIEIVNRTLWEGYTGCSEASSVFILITEGNTARGGMQQYNRTINKIQEALSNQSFSMKRMIFLVYLTAHMDEVEILRKMTCKFNGMVLVRDYNKKGQILGSSEVATQLQTFYRYLSVGIQLAKPIWTEPYFDYNTGRQMVTVSMPAYYKEKSTNFITLIGVTGIDILMDQFVTLGFNRSTSLLKLIGEKGCQATVLNNCRQEQFRREGYRCSVPSCILHDYVELNCSGIPETKDIFIYENMQNNEDQCCGLTNKQFGFIMGGSGIFILILITLVVLRKKIMRWCNLNGYKSVKPSIEKMSIESTAGSLVKKKLSSHSRLTPETRSSNNQNS